MLHRSLPPVLHRAAMTGLNTPTPGSESEVTMNAEDLLVWDRWGSAAKAFLREQTGDMALRPVIETHGYEMYKFNDWLLDLLIEENRPNLAAANELVVERNALVNRVDIPAARRLTEEWTRSQVPDAEQVVEAPGTHETSCLMPGRAPAGWGSSQSRSCRRHIRSVSPQTVRPCVSVASRFA